MIGEVAISGRNSQFEIRYDLPERVLPADVLAAPTPTLEDANLELVRRAARSHGVATVRCLSDYYRTLPQPARAVDQLVDDGRAEPVADRGLEAGRRTCTATPAGRAGSTPARC